MSSGRLAIRLQKCVEVSSRRILLRVVPRSTARHHSFWSAVEMGPPDPVYGLTEAFKACKNPKKVNLSIGTYQDDSGRPYVLPCVRKAEKLLDAMRLNKEYFLPEGEALYRHQCEQIILGKDSEQIKNQLTSTTQAVSRTGSCRLAFDFIKLFYNGKKKIFVPNPTWGNHLQIARHVELVFDYYRYYDNKTFGLDYKGLMEDISVFIYPAGCFNNSECLAGLQTKIPDKGVILFHGCAHNPTGVDPSRSQWEEMSDLVRKKRLLVVFDMAYHGFASGHFEVDAFSVRRFVEDGNNCMIIQSFCKNMGLYGDRPGGLIIISTKKGIAEKVQSQLRALAIPMYLTPPIHGARIAMKILSDSGLKDEWKREFKLIADRIISIRRILRSKLNKEGSIRNWDHIVNQNGMFCFTGLTKSQVKKLQVEHSIFMSETGRISIGQLNTKNVDYVAHAMHLITRYIR